MLTKAPRKGSRFLPDGLSVKVKTNLNPESGRWNTETLKSICSSAGFHTPSPSVDKWIWSWVISQRWVQTRHNFICEQPLSSILYLFKSDHPYASVPFFFFSISTAAERAAGCHSSLGSDWPQPTVRMPALQPALWNITQGICGSSAACERSCGSLWNSPLLCPLAACYTAERCLFLKRGFGQNRACMDLWWADSWTYDLWQ